MSTFYGTGIDDAINNGLTNLGGFFIEVRETAGGTTWDGPNGGTVSLNEQSWSGSGSTLPVEDTTLFTDRTAQADTQIQALYYKDASSGQQYFEIDNGGETGISLGTDVTLKTGSLDAVNVGLANVLRQGLSNVTVDAILRDGTGTSLSSQSIAISWFSGSDYFQNDNDVTFNNSSGGSWSVEELEVQADSDTFLSDTSVSATVNDGGSITFTTIELGIDNLS